MWDAPCRYYGDLLGRGGEACNFYGLMEGYNTVWRHWPRRLVAPSLSVDCLYFFFEVFLVAAGGMVCQLFVSQLLVPREPCERRLLVDSVVFPTELPPGVQGGDAIFVTGCEFMHSRDFQRSGCPDRTGRAACACDGRRSWSCTHLLSGNSNKMGGRQRSAVLMCLSLLLLAPWIVGV